MSKSDIKRNRSKKRLNRKAENHISMMINIIFVLLLASFCIYAVLHLFTHKKSYRADGIAHYKNGEYEEALADFDSAMGEKQWFSGKINADIMMYRADCLMRLDRFAEASNTYVTILRDYNDSHYDRDEVSYMSELALSLENFKNGDYVSTVAAFTKAVDAGHTEIAIFAAICYANQGKFDMMKQYADIYVASYGMTSYLYYEFAVYYIREGDYDSALLNVNAGLSAKDDTYKKELSYLEIVCYKEKQDFQKAYDLALSYQATYPGDALGTDILDFLDTRVNIDTHPINPFFESRPETSSDPSDE